MVEMQLVRGRGAMAYACLGMHTGKAGAPGAHACLDFTLTPPPPVLATWVLLLHDKPNAAEESTNGVVQTRLIEPQYADDGNGQ